MHAHIHFIVPFLGIILGFIYLRTVINGIFDYLERNPEAD